MKKIFYLLLLTAITLQAQTTGVNKLKIAANPEKTTAPRVMVQETNGDVGYVAKSSIQTDISGKVDKVAGKGLSTEDYTTAEKTKLSGIASGAEVNVNADWNAVSGDAQIFNKPSIPSISGLATETFVNNGLSTKENTIAPGTTSQYWRGDKTWQTLPSGGVWGSITGTLSSQTDLQNALKAKQDSLVSAINIRTINGNSILGQGDISIGLNTYPLSISAEWMSVWNQGRGGSDNTGTSFGYKALYNNSYPNPGDPNAGNMNTAFGSKAMYNNTSGFNNSAIGASALFHNTTGQANLAIGNGSMANNTTGSENLAIGVNSLHYLTTGSNNIVIGNGSGNDTVASIATQSNQIVIGNNFHRNAYIKIGWTVTSDARDKTNFAPVPYGLNFVNSLQPIKYQFRESRNTNVAVGDVKYGFKAQDILALEGSNPVIIDAKDPNNLKYTEGNMIPVLVNAIKELSQKVTALEAEVQILKNN